MQGLRLIERSRPAGQGPTAVLEGVRTLLMSLCVCLVLVPPAPVSAAARQVMSESGETRTAAERTRIYIGMWSTHIRDIDRGLKANSLVGVAYRGYFGATFINSFGDRGIALGIQRNFSPAHGAGVLPAFGYRLGIVTGYDERFFGIGDVVPALPFGQLVGTLDFSSVGLELVYSGIVASFVLNWRL